MKTYSLLEFLTQPIQSLLENDEDYRYHDLQTSLQGNQQSPNGISKINIPIIQRDYVQGHEKNKELLKIFVERLFAALEDQTQLKLDFIYGSLDVRNDQVFLPLDGQQRLTTLFLLHWYIIKKEANKEDFKTNYGWILTKFSYETRDTSRRFFKELVDFNFIDKPKEAIERSYWFTEHFALDPTVKACLNALEIIDEAYQKAKEKGALLGRLHQGLIVFYVLPMEQFKLTDDLYIKLNARGKVLSSFENFKADLIGFMNKLTDFTSPIEANEEGLTRGDVIGSKFDNEWSNLFWQIAKSNDNGEQSIDKYFFRFIHRLLINNYIASYVGSDINKDDIYKQLLAKEANLNYNNFVLYRQENLINASFLSELEVLLDGYLKHEQVIVKYITPAWMMKFEWSIYADGHTMNQRMIFDAINQFILHAPNAQFDEQRFAQWMRIVWNLLADPSNRNIEVNKMAMNVIRTIAPFSWDIYAVLRNGKLDHFINPAANIFYGQLKEEKTKAELILSDSGTRWLQEIVSAEGHGLFSGNIDFLLKDLQSPEQLSDRYQIALQLFDHKGGLEIVDGQSNSLIRYVIAKARHWETLLDLNYLINQDNWQTNLRRNDHVKQVFIDLIDLGDFSVIKQEVRNALKQDSGLADASFQQLRAHKNLYYANAFHNWMQQDSAGSIRERHGHLYVYRPKAHYSKAMIDGYRNEFLQALIIHFNITEVHNRCGTTEYFWGEWFDCFKTIGDKIITFNFDVSNYVHVGLWGERNPQIANVENSSGGWIEIHTFDLNSLQSVQDIPGLLKDIENSIAQDDTSLIKDLLLEANIEAPLDVTDN